MKSTTPAQITHFHENMPAQEYFDSPGIGGTKMKSLCNSVAEFETPKEFTEQAKKSMGFGTAFHEKMDKSSKFSDKYIVAHNVPVNKDGSLSKRSAEFKELVANSDGKELLSKYEWEYLVKMQDNVLNHKFAKDTNLYDGGEYETSLFTEDPGTGIRVKGRFDYLNRNQQIFVDFKTTKDANPDFIVNAIYNMRYHVQAACYKAILDLEFDADYRCIYAFVANKPPHLVTYVEIAGEVLAHGMMLRRKALDNLDQYQREDNEVVKKELYGYPQKLMVLK